MNAESIFHAARQKRDPVERAGFLDGACAGDVALRAKVDALLEADEDAGSFLKTIDVGEADTTVVAAGREGPGDTIGRYKLLQCIGEGGFGVVWLAEQREPVKRRVALKIIKLGMDTQQVIARFEAERQALAMMEHANIAKVLDAGATETGRPYFVMELVKGVPILEYCDTEKLDTRARLELFTQVCHAIQHAHQKGIIHRDIKPGNVLVTMHDGVPVPKVIDFGIAKATNQELTERTLFTEHRQLVGTPAYMSPEQAEMSGLDIDTRSDIYSLGVLLYELLTGTTPFDTNALLSAGFAEMMRIIREDEPHKPSTRLSTLGDTATKIADQRRADARRLGTLLRGDLDWIAMKCLEKDRTRRYETAAELAADVQRHLNDQPVEAGPPGAAYRLRKFVKRRRSGVLVGLVITIVMAAGTGAWWASSQETRREREARTELLDDSLIRAGELLGAARGASIADDGPWIEARGAAKHIEKILASGRVDAEAQARANTFLTEFTAADRGRSFAERVEEIVITGATHMDAVSWQRMERNLVVAFKTYDIDLDVHTPDEVASRIRASGEPVRLADALELWIGTIGQLGNFGAPMMDMSTMQTWIAVLYEVDDDPLRTAVRHLHYDRRQYRIEEIDELFKDVDLRGVHARTLAWAAMLYGIAGEPDRADELVRRALLVHPDDFMLNFDFALGLEVQEKWNEAIRYYMRCLVLRPDSSGIWRSMGVALRKNRELGESASALTRAVTLDPAHLPTRVDLAWTLLEQGQLEQAKTTCRDVIAEDEQLAEAHACLGRVLMRDGLIEEGRTTLKRALDLSGSNQVLAARIQGWLEEDDQ